MVSYDTRINSAPLNVNVVKRIRHNYSYLYLYGFQSQNPFRFNCQRRNAKDDGIGSRTNTGTGQTNRKIEVYERNHCQLKSCFEVYLTSK